MAKPSEYTLFMDYIDKVKDFLQNNTYLKKFPKNENVRVFFATPPAAFSKFLMPVLNGANLNPTISFYMTNPTYLKNENLLGFSILPKRVGQNEYLKIKPPLIYNLNFKISILTGNERDADILQYQILAKAPFSRPYAFKINNQWGTLYADNPGIDTEITPGEAKDKIIARSLDIIIPRAYLPVESEITSGIIEEINIRYEANGSTN